MLSRWTLLLLVTAVALMVAHAPAAQADHLTTSGFKSVQRSLRIATDAWSGHLDHCRESGVYLYAYEPSEHPDESDSYAFATVGGCEIYFNADQADNYTRRWFCSVMTHEMGHSAGFDHTEDPGDIMNGPNEVYWRRCLSRGEARRLRRMAGVFVDGSIADHSRKTLFREPLRRVHTDDMLTPADAQALRQHGARPVAHFDSL